MADPFAYDPGPLALDDDEVRQGLAKLLMNSPEAQAMPSAQPQVQSQPRPQPNPNLAQSVAKVLAYSRAQQAQQDAAQPSPLSQAAQKVLAYTRAQQQPQNLQQPQISAQPSRQQQNAQKVLNYTRGQQQLQPAPAMPSSAGAPQSSMSSLPSTTPLRPVANAGGGMSNRLAPPVAVRDMAGNPISQNDSSSLRQRWNDILNDPQQRQPALINAGGPGPGALPVSSASLDSMPGLGTPAQPNVIAPRGTVAGDTAELNRLQDTGSGISQIKRPWLRGLATAADIAGMIAAPGLEEKIPGTQGRHNLLVAEAQNDIANDRAQLQQDATLANTRADASYKQAQLQTLLNPQPKQPDYVSLPGEGPNGEPLEIDKTTGTGRIVPGIPGASTKSKTPAEGETPLGTSVGQFNQILADRYHVLNPDKPVPSQYVLPSNATQKDYDRVDKGLTGIENAQGNLDQRRQTDAFRRLALSLASDRLSGRGAPKPIPPGIRLRIQGQKDTAIGKARADFDSGTTDLDSYLDDWQQAQNNFEDAIAAQTGQDVPHVDIRSNVDNKGNWIGQAAPQPVQTKQPQQTHSFVTPKTKQKVKVGDPVTVGDRTGIVTGFNARTGKVQVDWSRE